MMLMIHLILLLHLIAQNKCFAFFRGYGRHRPFLSGKGSEIAFSKDVVDVAAHTSLLLLLSYDGGRFTGWSAANKNETGFVRSVEGVLREKLAKIFGEVDPLRIVVEGTSRTDKGVHAKRMVVQVYCLAQDWESAKSSIPGKRRPHPRTSTDKDCFVPFPMTPTRLVFVLNRMFPDDISIHGICPSPLTEGRPFHSSLDAVSKTYQYTFSVGSINDPTQWRRTWHVGDSFDVSKLESVLITLEGRHDFRAFRGAPRGMDDRRRHQEKSSICTLHKVSISEFSTGPIPGLKTYHVTVRGDRFLYKMVRFLIGTIVAIGQGKLNATDVEVALASGSFEPKRKPQCAPGNGLVLVDTQHVVEFDWIK